MTTLSSGHGKRLARAILIQRYSRRTAEMVRRMISERVVGTVLHNATDSLFQVCDELIKNAVKSNYKFLLLWEATRERLRQVHPEFSEKEAEDWLGEVFFSGESVLIERQLAHLENRDALTKRVRKILDIENELARRGIETDTLIRPELKNQDAGEFHRLRALAQRLNVHVQFRVETSPDELLITVANDAPVLQEDVTRIHNFRSKFREYYDQGRQTDFFVENLDTAGGGHGLGYAVMDAILLDLGLNPEQCLFLISASRTMVLVALPLVEKTA